MKKTRLPLDLGQLSITEGLEENGTFLVEGGAGTGGRELSMVNSSCILLHVKVGKV
jgi:hypothetical protein